MQHHQAAQTKHCNGTVLQHFTVAFALHGADKLSLLPNMLTMQQAVDITSSLGDNVQDKSWAEHAIVAGDAQESHTSSMRQHQTGYSIPQGWDELVHDAKPHSATLCPFAYRQAPSCSHVSQ